MRLLSLFFLSVDLSMCWTQARSHYKLLISKTLVVSLRAVRVILLWTIASPVLMPWRDDNGG